MHKLLKTLTAAAAIGLGSLVAVPTLAQADTGFHLGFGDRDARGRIGIYLGRDRADYRRYGRWEPRGCTIGRAVNKAERMGLRRVRVVDVDRWTIKVVGARYGDRMRITFARAPNCPVIRR